MLAAIALWLCTASARGAHVLFDLRDFTTDITSVTNRLLKIEPLSTPKADTGRVIISEPKSYLIPSSAQVTVSNMVAGSYRCSVFGIYQTTRFDITIPDTNATLNASEYLSTTINVDAAYTASAADARFVRQADPYITVTGAVGYVLTLLSTNGQMGLREAPGASGGEANTISSLGVSNATVKPIAAGKSGVDLQTYSLEAGANMSLSMTDTSIVLDASSSGGKTYNFDGTQFGAVNETNITLLSAAYITNAALYSGYTMRDAEAVTRRGTNVIYGGLSNALATAQAGDVITVLPTTLSNFYAEPYDASGPTNTSYIIDGKTNVTVIGYGATLHATNFGHILTVMDCSNIVVEGLTFIGDTNGISTSSSIAAAINFHRTNQYVAVRNCRFLEIPNQAISHCFGQRVTEHWTVEGCYFHDIGDTNWPPLSQPDGSCISGAPRKAIIRGNRADGLIAAYFLELDAGNLPTSEDIIGGVVDGNYVEGLYNFGIVLQGKSGSTYGRVTIHGNVLREHETIVRATTHYLIRLLDSRDTVISGNVLEAGASSTAAFLISMEPDSSTITNIIITGNTLYGGRYGIHAPNNVSAGRHIRGVVVSGNTFREQQLAPIWVSGEDWVIDHNAFLGGGIGGTYPAIFIVADSTRSATNIMIANNLCDDLRPTATLDYFVGHGGSSGTAYDITLLHNEIRRVATAPYDDLSSFSGLTILDQIGDGLSVGATNAAPTGGIRSAGGLALPGYNATVDYSWKCTNATTGEGEWRVDNIGQPSSTTLTNLSNTGALTNANANQFDISNYILTLLDGAKATNLYTYGTATNVALRVLGDATIDTTLTVNDIATVNSPAYVNDQLNVTGPLNAGGRVTVTNNLTLLPHTLSYTDGTNVLIDCALGNEFRLTVTNTVWLANPTNAVDGQRITVMFIQDSTGGYTNAFDARWTFGSEITSADISTNANSRSYMTAIYYGSTTNWDIVGFTTGY